MKQKYFILLIFIMLSTMLFSVEKNNFNKNLVKSTTLSSPEILPATNISTKGFDANWKAVPGTEAYCVYVYTKHKALEDETYTVLDEDFSRINFGSIKDPIWSDNIYEKLDGYTTLPDWGIYGYASYAKGMVSGVIYTPYLDLRNDAGSFVVDITIYGIAGDTIYVHSKGMEITKETQSFTLKETGYNKATLSFSNGVRDSYLHIHNYDGTYYYLDDITVKQNLKKGDETLTTIALNEAVTDGVTTASFRDMTYAYGAQTVYYSVYAVARYYPDPNDPYEYTQYYSDYSNLMEVNLFSLGISDTSNNNEIIKIEGGYGVLNIRTVHATDASIYTTDGKLQTHLHCIEGDNHISLNSGIYLIQIKNKTHKIIIK